MILIFYCTYFYLLFINSFAFAFTSAALATLQRFHLVLLRFAWPVLQFAVDRTIMRLSLLQAIEIDTKRVRVECEKMLLFSAACFVESKT